jgi:hypothetical protein
MKDQPMGSAEMAYRNSLGVEEGLGVDPPGRSDEARRAAQDADWRERVRDKAVERPSSWTWIDVERACIEQDRDLALLYAQYIAEAEDTSRSPGERWVWRIRAHRSRHGGGLREARDAVLAADHEEALTMDAVRPTERLAPHTADGLVQEIERVVDKAVAEIRGWADILADATRTLERLRSDLRDAARVPARLAPVNAALDASAGAACVIGLHAFQPLRGMDRCSVPVTSDDGFIAGWCDKPRSASVHNVVDGS